MRQFDFLVIGGGPAGQKGAIQAAKLRKRVGLVERRAFGAGASIHAGAIPSKTLRDTVLSAIGGRARDSGGRGIRRQNDIEFGDLRRRLHAARRQELDGVRDQLHRSGVETIEGRAYFATPNRVRVEKPGGETEDVEAQKILVATGTRPIRPSDVPFDDTCVLDTESVLGLEELPRTMTVVGADVLGVEYATIFGALGVVVSLVDGRDKILPFLDREIVSDLEFHLRDHGVVLRLDEGVEAIRREGDQAVTYLKSGKQLASDVVLFAAGRAGCTDELHLAAAGLSPDDKGRLAVNAHFRTSEPGIYAAGGVIGFPSVASTSMEQGRLAACDAFGVSMTSLPELYPFAVYSAPEISMVGATEQDLCERRIPYEAGVARLRETAHGQMLGIESGILKILFSLDTRKVLGVHILGEGAAELIHVGQVALVLGGTVEYFVENVFNTRTLAEAYRIAALDAWSRMPRRRVSPAVESGASFSNEVQPLPRNGAAPRPAPFYPAALRPALPEGADLLPVACSVSPEGRTIEAYPSA